MWQRLWEEATAAQRLCACAVVPATVWLVHPQQRASVVVLTRTLRPYVKLLGVVGWFAYRLVGPFFTTSSTATSSLSLWQGLVDGMAGIHDACQAWSPVAGGAWSLLQDASVFLLLAAVSRTGYTILHGSFAEYKAWIVNAAFDWAKEHLSVVQTELRKETEKLKADVVRAKAEKPANQHQSAFQHALPAQGRAIPGVLAELVHSSRTDNAHWEAGRVSGTVYPCSPAHTDLMNAAYAAYSWSNPLHTDVWPSLNRFEAQVIAMTASLVNPTKEGEKKDARIHGTTTSGGTESIFLAIKAHRERYGFQRYIQYPGLICGPTAHAAVDKACELMGIRKVVVAPTDDFCLCPAAVERCITANTILIYASAPNYPQGVIDPISQLSQLALRYDIGLHVDACLGGFVLPFCRKLGYDIPSFDFSNAGVTSMSVDTHKYAYASKGTSVVLYRDETLRQAQYFPYAQWTGGLYSTPTLAGSRPGALLACAWAALVSIGHEGYEERVALILQASHKIAKGIRDMKDVHVLGKQLPTMIVCFSSATLDIYRIGDMMETRGWSLNALQHPACLHMCVTLNTVAHVDAFLLDLEASIGEARTEGAVGQTKGTAAIYGTTSSLPAGPVNALLRVFTDVSSLPS
jgi:sphinganine-1-phosphate aldolase